MENKPGSEDGEITENVSKITTLTFDNKQQTVNKKAHGGVVLNFLWLHSHLCHLVGELELTQI